MKQGDCDSQTARLGLLRRLKEEFRKWYGLVSIRELLANKQLVREIENIEKLFAVQGV